MDTKNTTDWKYYIFSFFTRLTVSDMTGRYAAQRDVPSRFIDDLSDNQIIHPSWTDSQFITKLQRNTHAVTH